MPKRHVYSKDTTGYGDFVYVDLLPEVRRARQFNMRVIVLLLITITVTFVLVYLIKVVSFNLNNETIIFTVSMVNSYRFTTLNNQILDIDWVATSVYTDPVRYGNDVEYTAQFTIGVKYDAE